MPFATSSRASPPHREVLPEDFDDVAGRFGVLENLDEALPFLGDPVPGGGHRR